jgi:hypothetical protein
MAVTTDHQTEPIAPLASWDREHEWPVVNAVRGTSKLLSRDLDAVRQFHVCPEALRRDPDLMPQRERVSPYQEVLANRVATRKTQRKRAEVVSHRSARDGPNCATPCVGRQKVLECLLANLPFVLAAVRSLSEPADTRRLLLVVDDLHETDPLSLDVLRYFAHLARRRRWLLVAAVREKELPRECAVARRLEPTLGEGVRAKLELPSLSLADYHRLGRLLAGDERFDDDVAGPIFARSGGNPLFIEALVDDAHGLREQCLGNTPVGEPSARDARRNSSLQQGAHAPARIRCVVTSQLRALDHTVHRTEWTTAGEVAPRLSPISWVIVFTTLVGSRHGWETPASFIESHFDGDRLEPLRSSWPIVPNGLPLLDPEGNER